MSVDMLGSRSLSFSIVSPLSSAAGLISRRCDAPYCLKFHTINIIDKNSYLPRHFKTVTAPTTCLGRRRNPWTFACRCLDPVTCSHATYRTALHSKCIIKNFQFYNKAHSFPLASFSSWTGGQAHVNRSVTTHV